jgi:hypothetical protein
LSWASMDLVFSRSGCAVAAAVGISADRARRRVNCRGALLMIVTRSLAFSFTSSWRRSESGAHGSSRIRWPRRSVSDGGAPERKTGRSAAAALIF